MATENDTNCPADQFTKVSTAMTKGVISALDNSPTLYLYAVVLTGGTAPTVIGDGTVFYGEVVYNSVDAVDIYVWPSVNAGKIRERKES